MVQELLSQGEETVYDQEQSRVVGGSAMLAAALRMVKLCLQARLALLIQTGQKQVDYSQLKGQNTAKEGFNLLDIDNKEENLHAV